MSVQFTSKARAHIRAMKAYSAHRWGMEVAEAYVTSLRITITEILDRQPSSGRDRSKDFWPDVRSFPVESHIIYYRETLTGIDVLAVLHQSQDPCKHG